MPGCVLEALVSGGGLDVQWRVGWMTWCVLEALVCDGGLGVCWRPWLCDGSHGV